MYTIIEESGFDRKFYFDNGTSHVRLLTKIAIEGGIAPEGSLSHEVFIDLQ